LILGRPARSPARGDDPEPPGRVVPGPALLEEGRQAKGGGVLKVKVFPDEDLCNEKPALLTINGKATTGTGANRTLRTPKLARGQKYAYSLVVKWQPNNYETYTRTRKVLVSADQTVAVDLTKKTPKVDDDIFIRYVPTPKEFVTAMMKLAKVGKGDVVYDLGCGDGRILIAAVSKHGAKAGVGVELDPKLVKQARENAKKAKVDEAIEIREGDVMKVKDLNKATVVCLYLSDGLNGQLWPILNKHCKPGTRIVSHRFKMGERGEETGPPPEKSIKVQSDEHGFDYTEEIHLWTIKGKK
jgi:uncharacterized protein (TIGR03000 family)